MVALMAVIAVSMLSACGGDDPAPVLPNPAPSPAPTPAPEPDPDPSPVVVEFAKGADVSWLTQLESEGHTFANRSGERKECMALLKEDCGMNAIRLRVWVNPTDGWCGLQDLLVKARRAHALGLALMVDFHFSDTWADPGAQTPPAAWDASSPSSLKSSISTHVKQVLTALKDEGITPQWVQLGNETCNGMLWPAGKLDVEGNHFAEFVTAAHLAAKSVFPDVKTIVHTDQGDNPSRFDWVYGALKEAGAQYDMIGVSFYPELDWDKGWLDLSEEQKVTSVIDNLRRAYADYGKESIIVEFGMNYDRPADTSAILTSLLRQARATDFIKGIFYWEPEAPAGYNGGYLKGAFDGGRPTAALDPFLQ